MNDLVFFRDTHIRIAQADALIELAAKVRDWKLLVDAVDAKIGEQQVFVQWWDEHVRAPGNQPNNSARELIGRAEAEERGGFSQVQVSRWRTALKDSDKYRERQILAAMRKAEIAPGENHRAECSGEFEWYTPARYIELARGVMGGIDLDPASNAIAQQWIQADQYFTPTQNGLAQEWHGRVWLNPPYSQPAIGRARGGCRSVARRGQGR
jgi:uncharacterized membrane-anchored protein